MRWTLVLAFCAFTSALPDLGAQNASPADRGLPRVVIQTDAGEIELEIDSVRAPITAANFLRYVDSARYDGGRFHRTVTSANQPTDSVRIEVIQAGATRPPGVEPFPPIQLERTSVTGILHKDGTVSMARNGPDTARSDFFICIGDQPSLDFAGRRNADGQGFAAFGRVVRGMEVVRRIHHMPATAQRLTPPVAIISAKRQAASGKRGKREAVRRQRGSR